MSGFTQDGCAYSAQDSSSLCSAQSGHDVVNTATVTWTNGASPVRVEWLDQYQQVYTYYTVSSGAGTHSFTWYLCCFGSTCFHNYMRVTDAMGRSSAPFYFQWECDVTDNPTCSGTCKYP